MASTPAHGNHQKHRVRRFAALAAVAMLTACAPVAKEAQRLPLDRLPETQPPAVRPSTKALSPATAPPAKPSAAAPTAAAPSAVARAAAEPTATAPSTAAPSAGQRPTPGQPVPAVDPAVHKLPEGDLPGWKQVFVEDFEGGDVPIGAFPGPAYIDKWSAGYKDGWPDSAGQTGQPSRYYPSKVLSVKNGMLDWYLHSENGISMGAAPTPKIPNATTNPPRANSLLYGRYSVRFKADPLKGFKTAWLLWPDSKMWPRDGEIDFPESDLATSSFYGAVHKMGKDPRDTDVFYANASFTSWHVATMEWTPGKVEFFLDGHSLGAGTSRVPNTPMHYILQTESCMFNVCPKPQTAGHLHLDWIAIWKRA